MRRTLAVTAIAAAAAIALAGCGTTEAPEEEGAASGDSITVTDARGVEVTIEGPVESVVALEWVAVEHVQTVGLELAGVADVDGYEDWSGTGAPLEGDPVDVGTRGESSVDAVAEIAPDLIIGVAGGTDEQVEQMEAIAPVVILQAADASAPLDTMLADLRLVGEATGHEDEAEAAIDEFETHLDELTSTVEEAGLAGTPIAHLDGYENGGQVEIRTYESGSLLAAAAQRIGFTTAFTGEGDEQYGLGITDVEGLTDLPDDARLVYMTVGDDDVFAGALQSNAIYTGLAAVQEGHVTRLPDGIWLFGGVHSVSTYLDELVAAVQA